MKSLAAQIESVISPAIEAVRAAASALREADAQLEKIDRKIAAARDAQAHRRVTLGKALVRAHEEMRVRRGDRSGRWAAMLEQEGIETRTAQRYMELAGYVESTSDTEADESEVPTYADAGIDKRPRKTEREREEQPDHEDEAARVEVISPGAAIDLRLGRWETALLDIGKVDAVIVDPPYGARTHASQATRSDNSDVEGLAPTYDAWTADDVAGFVEVWSERCRGWIVALTSDDLIPAWRAAYRANDRIDFAPVPCVITGMSVRLHDDGPSSWAVYAMVSRPRNLSKWGVLPGAYIGGRVHGAKSGRGKPMWLMNDLVRDYTRAGDLVCDPLAGYGVTLTSALFHGRRAVGAEIDEDARREAITRWRAGVWKTDPRNAAGPAT